MSLTRKQTATFNAALALIHSNGHDVHAVTRDVQARIGNGTPPKLAYERALNAFVDRQPDMLAPLQRTTKLIEASDDRTVAKYNVALSRYIETGDEGVMAGLATMIAQDVAQLAARTGETAPDMPAEIADMIAAERAAVPAKATDLYANGSQGLPAHAQAGIGAE